MSELGHLLELMHTADNRWRSIRIEGREWVRPDLSFRGFLRAASRSGSDVPGGRSHREPAPLERESRWRLWRSMPDRGRGEFDVDTETVTTVIRDATWWIWSPSGPVRTNGGEAGSSAGLGPGEALLGPAAILAAVQLGPLGTAMVAGRAAVRARAGPVRIPDEPDAGASLHGLGAGADEYELLVDAERGVLLRAEARLEKEPFRVLEAVHVEFDPELPEETFSPPPSRPAVPDSRPLTLELHQAAGAVPFAVFVPERPPPGSCPADVTIDRPDPDDRTRQILYISWHAPPEDGRGGRSHDNLTLMEAAEPLPDIPGIEWSDIAGLRVGSEHHGWQSITRIRLVIGGTHVDLSSDDIPRERLLDYARSLVRLPEGPPALRQAPPE